MVCPGFCPDVSGFVVHSCFFPALGGPASRSSEPFQGERSSVGDAWLCLLPAKRRGRGEVMVWAAPGGPLLWLGWGERRGIPDARGAPDPMGLAQG